MRSFDATPEGWRSLAAELAAQPTHAYLFEAPAVIWEQVETMCRAALWGADDEGAHPDWRVVGLDKRVGRDDVRGWPEEALVPPVLAPIKVLVVRRADRMTEEAQNLLLKVVEEPPPHAATVLLAEEAVAVAVTLRSRCRQMRVQSDVPPEVSDAARALLAGRVQGDGWPGALAEAAVCLRGALERESASTPAQGRLIEQWQALEAAAWALDGNANRELVAWQLEQRLRGRRPGGSI
jgi:hypothetical protein